MDTNANIYKFSGIIRNILMIISMLFIFEETNETQKRSTFSIKDKTVTSNESGELSVIKEIPTLKVKKNYSSSLKNSFSNSTFLSFFITNIYDVLYFKSSDLYFPTNFTNLSFLKQLHISQMRC